MNSVSGIRKKKLNIEVLRIGAKLCFRRVPVCIFLALFFAGCSDYVGQIDEQIDAFNAHEKARELSRFVTDDILVNSEDVFEGSFKDSRDKKVYKTVTIGSQTWMAENLNYKVSGSYCYNDDSTNCDKYGRLYTWAAAMDSVGKFSSNAKGCGYGKICAPTYPVRGVCPEGWHFPSYGDWETLLYAVDQSRFMASDVKLKSKNGWKSNRGGDDEYGFSVLPAGAKIDKGKYYHKEMNAYFWLSTEYSNDFAENFYIGISDGASLNTSEKRYAYSIRCVKDIADEKPIKSSSSSKEKSSSSVIMYGELKDSRDGKTYKTVKIGTQTWMAENLNYEMDGSYCYNDSTEYCAKYGRYYIWNAAREACPKGWHLPNYSEWEELLAIVGGESEAGRKLRTIDGWNSNGANDKGSNEYGFSVLPTGSRNYDGGCREIEEFARKQEDGGDAYYRDLEKRKAYHYSSYGFDAYFWSSDEDQQEDVYAYLMYFWNNFASMNPDCKNMGISIRCVEGEVKEKTSSSSLKKYSSSSFSSSLSEKSSSPAVYSESGSSGSVESSNSFAYVEPCKSENLDTCVYGKLTDERDGQAYKTVLIGSQTWMAENLNYEVENSYCFENDYENCRKYGRLYVWSVAMDSAGIWSSNSLGCGEGNACMPMLPVRGVCPEGWHLPDSSEWERLFKAVYGKITAGKVLKNRSDWENGWRGTDAYGFSALPAGIVDLNGPTFYMMGYISYFWSSTEFNDEYAYGVHFEADSAGVSENNQKYLGFSIRCVKD